METKNNNIQNPAMSAESVNKLRKQKKAFARKSRIVKNNISAEEIEKITAQEKSRIIMCLLYGSYTVDTGTTRKVKKKKEEIEVPNILHGMRAVTYTLGKNKITVLSAKGNYVVVQSDTDHQEEVVKIMEPMGKIQITKWHPKKEKPKKQRKKTNNTDEVRKEAKKKRKQQNIAKAAARKGYSMRKKHNRFKNKGKFTPQHNTTTLEIKRSERAKKVGRALIKAEEIKAVQAKKAAENAAKKAANTKKAASKKEQSLKLAA